MTFSLATTLRWLIFFFCFFGTYLWCIFFCLICRVFSVSFWNLFGLHSPIPIKQKKFCKAGNNCFSTSLYRKYKFELLLIFILKLKKVFGKPHPTVFLHEVTLLSLTPPNVSNLTHYFLLKSVVMLHFFFKLGFKVGFVIYYLPICHCFQNRKVIMKKIKNVKQNYPLIGLAWSYIVRCIIQHVVFETIWNEVEYEYFVSKNWTSWNETVSCFNIFKHLKCTTSRKF